MQLTTPIYTGWAAVTPSDTTLINCRALWIGGVGTFALSTSPTAAPVTFSGLAAAGTIIPVELNQGRVMSTGTTATLIIALT